MAEFTRRRARQHCRAHLASIRERLIRMARHWDELDMSVVYEIDRALAEVEALGAAMDEAVSDRADADAGELPV